MAYNNYEDNVAYATQIFAEYGDFIYQIALYKLGDENLADDLYQNFFLSQISNPVPSDVRNIKSYLYRALINDFLDEKRRSKNQKKNLKKYAKDLDFPINKSCSTDALINEEQNSKMFEIIGGQLSPVEFEAIELRYKEGYSLNEVAKRMKVKKGSVSRYISVGLKKFQSFFKMEQRKPDDWL